MKVKHIVAKNLESLYVKALDAIMVEGDTFNVGYGSEETETRKLCVLLEVLNPQERPIIHYKAPNTEEYIYTEYFPRYLLGIKERENWGRLPDEHYTYAELMRSPVDQIDWVIKRLLQNSWDRQLTVTLGRPEHIVKGAVRFEPPCLRSVHFERCGDQLNIFVDFRSWDCLGGLPCNLAGLQVLNEYVVSMIEDKYPTLTTGKLVAFSKNLHIYAREYPAVRALFSCDGLRMTQAKLGGK